MSVFPLLNVYYVLPFTFRANALLPVGQIVDQSSNCDKDKWPEKTTYDEEKQDNTELQAPRCGIFRRAFIVAVRTMDRLCHRCLRS